jgi:hypothetical protein
MYYCTVTDNENTQTGSNGAGGAGVYLEPGNGTYFYAFQTIISNNKAQNRGGGIRTGSASGMKLILEQCLVAGNSLIQGTSGNYGGGIQGSGATAWMCLINTTVTGNIISGKGGAGISCDGTIYLISSTVTGNTATDNSEGNDLRVRNAASTLRQINSIVVGGASSSISATSAVQTSNGYNVFGSIDNSAQITTVGTDLTGQTATSIFGANTLTNNGGAMQTIMPETKIGGATLAELREFMKTYSLTEGDVTKDARGLLRYCTANRGAYDHDADGNGCPPPQNTFNPLDEANPIIWNQGYGENSFIRFPASYESTIKAIPTNGSAIWTRATFSAGLQLRFKTNSDTIKIRYSIESTYNNTTSMQWFSDMGAMGIDLYARKNGTMYWCNPTSAIIADEFIYANLIPDDADYAINGYEYCLYLPSFAHTTSVEIEVTGNADFDWIKANSLKKPVVFYGTSIINGAAAHRAGNNYTNIISRELYDRPIVNLGFSGSGRMEKPVITAVNNIDADIYILDCLPNMNGDYLSTIKELYIAAVDSIKKYHPTAKIILTEHPGYASMDNYTSHYNTVTNENIQLQQAKAEIDTKGYSGIYYISIAELGLNRQEDFSDYIHPNDKGMYKYAAKYLEIIQDILGE